MKMNFAHMPGACGVAVSPDGAYLLTSGSDATVRAHDIRAADGAWWLSDAGNEPEVPDMSIAELHDKPVGTVAVAADNKTVATGSDDGFVRIFSMKSSVDHAASNGLGSLLVDGELVQACARFGGPVRALCFSPTGAFLAAAGDEPGVLKIIMTAQPSNVNVLRGSVGGKGQEPIVYVAFDPNSDFVATVGERGGAAIWDIEHGTFAGAISINDRAARCVAWSPDGCKLVVGTDKGAVIVSRDSWMFDYLLEDAGDQDDDDDNEIVFAGTAGKSVITCVAWSPNGQYVLTGREDAHVAVWDVEKRQVLGVWKAEEVVQDLHWHPRANAFILVDRIGQWSIVADVVPPHMPVPHEKTSTTPELPTLPNGGEGSVAGNDDSDLDEDDLVRRSKSARKKRLKQQQQRKLKAKERRSDETADGDGDGSNLEDANPDDGDDEHGFADTLSFDASDLEPDEEDELQDRARYRGDVDDLSNSENDDSHDVGDNSSFDNGFSGGYRRGRTPSKKGRRRRSANGQDRAWLPPEAQPSFMPSATPLAEKGTKKKRILGWNLTGAILSFDETTHDLVEIEFADTTRRSVGIKDHFGYTMGCLSGTGVLLATPQTKDHGSLISFRPFSSWSNNSDWTQPLRSSENALAIALGQRFAAVATTPDNLVRLFSLSGIETGVFGVPGRIVTAAAEKNQLAIVYAQAGSSVLQFELLEIGSTGEVEKAVCRGPIVLSPSARLEWVGFMTDTGDLTMYDSRGWLWVMPNARGAQRWVPLMQNAAASAECDWFWVAAVTSTSIVGAPCLSNERYPPARPRPALRTLPLSAPVIEKLDKAGKPTLAERFARTKLRLNRAIVARTEAEEMYDSDDEEWDEAVDAVVTLEVEADKCILALMEEACRNENNLRAFDLATRLHSKVSFKYAVDLANHFKRTALAGRVEEIALRKIEIIEEEEREREQKGNRVSPTTPLPQPAQRVSGPTPDSVCRGNALSRQNQEAAESELEAESEHERMEQIQQRMAPPTKRVFASSSSHARKSASSKPAVPSPFDDVSDDDDEDLIATKPISAAPTTAAKRAASKTKQKASGNAPRVDRKRPAPVELSQASRKAPGPLLNSAAKKAKTASANTSNAGKRGGVVNRFSKKSNACKTPL